MRLAAIDIGSNAVRLLLSETILDDRAIPSFSKLNLVRIPLRLGFDVFETGSISEEKADRLIETLQAFKLLMSVYETRHVKACATSAMRDATNREAVIRRVRQETGIQIELLTGDAEAALLFESHIAERLDGSGAYLYVDVGGGSTELTYFYNGRPQERRSFDIGTIRLLKGSVEDAEWTGMRDYLKEGARKHRRVTAIGSGGNINKIFSLSKRKEGKPLTLEMLQDYHREMGSLGVPERMRLYNLRADRADVIVPALQIYINVMRWSDATEMYVPKIGLADGLIQHLYEELMRSWQ